MPAVDDCFEHAPVHTSRLALGRDEEMTLIIRTTICMAVFMLVGCKGVQQDPAKVSTDTAVAAAADDKTKLERFAAKHGVAVIRGFTQIGDVPGEYGGAVTVGAAELTNAATGEKERGIWIRVKESGTLERENTSSIDYDEIDSLLKGIDFIAKADGSVTKLNSWQADYATRDDFRVSTFSSSRQDVMASVASGQIGAAQVFFTRDNLSRLRGMIANAKNTLDVIAAEEADAAKKKK